MKHFIKLIFFGLLTMLYCAHFFSAERSSTPTPEEEIPILFDAIKYSDIDRVRQELDQGADVNHVYV